MRRLTALDLQRAMSLEGFDPRSAHRLLAPRGRQLFPPPDRPEPAAAGALCYCFPQGGEGLGFPVIVRRTTLNRHAGQVAFPGGLREPGEGVHEAAWREAGEEIGLRVQGAAELGSLAPIYIPVSHTRLTVYVASGPPPPTPFRPQPEEVERVVVVSLDELLDPGRRGTGPRATVGGVREVPLMRLGALEVWGATAMALSELAERLRRAIA